MVCESHTEYGFQKEIYSQLVHTKYDSVAQWLNTNVT